jgi:excisionase family DNA binding protein
MDAFIQSALETVVTPKFTNTENLITNLALQVASLEKTVKELLAKANPEERLTIRQAAKVLKLEEDTVREYCKKDKIKYEKIGARYRIKMSEITNYLNRN